MDFGMVPKVYEVDYGFIVRNYLNEELWNKEWNIYSYKYLRFTIQLHRIDCYDRSICFKIKIYNDQESYTSDNTFYFYKTHENFKVLKKQINGCIYDLMKNYERHLIINSDEYKELLSMFSDEEDNLTQIAEEFLDSEGVTNKSIREAYIDDYVSNNRKEYNAMESFREMKKFLIIPDYYITFLESVEDEERLTKVQAKLRNNIDEDEYDRIMEQARIVSEFDEDYRNEMMSELEDVC